jgi:hypothetical protein
MNALKHLIYVSTEQRSIVDSIRFPPVSPVSLVSIASIHRLFQALDVLRPYLPRTRLWC